MSTTDRVRTLVEPVVTGLGLELFDVEHSGGILRITVDRASGASDGPSGASEGQGGLDLDVISRASRTISRILDEHDPVPGRYTLEVTSPGLERRLRTPEHFARAIGAEVTVKTRVEIDGQRRFGGTLVAADDTGFTVRGADDLVEHHLAYDQIDKARTVFEWGPAPKPSHAKGNGTRNQRKPRLNQKKKASAR